MRPNLDSIREAQYYGDGNDDDDGEMGIFPSFSQRMGQQRYPSDNN